MNIKVRSYIGWWFIVFIITYVAVSSTVFAPEEIKDFNSRLTDLVWPAREAATAARLSKGDKSADSVAETAGNPLPIFPSRLIIPKIGVDDPISNPQSADPKVLDDNLNRGVVRYPGSATLSDNANMFLFGHSTNWAIVHNQAYKSLNGLGNLNLGDYVEVDSSDTEYIYKVISTALVDKNEALVDFQSGRRMITISTCDTFGAKSDRFVVEAIFVKSNSLPNVKVD